MLGTVLIALSLATPEPGTELAPMAPGPRVTLDLRTDDGAAAAHAVWRATPVHLLPGEGTSSSYSIHPGYGSTDYEQAPWDTLMPTSLESRRGDGGVSFEWYRLTLEIPENVNGFSTEGARVILDLRVDDYAEVWVNGVLPFRFAQSGQGVVAGWNASNRIALTDFAKPGERFDVAVFAANGPISLEPENKIWIREARLEFYAQPRGLTPEPVETRVTRFTPGLEALLGPNPKAERIATGFIFTEGPVWDRSQGRLLFSDPNANTIYSWSEAQGVRTVMSQSGYDGADIDEYRQPGSNGLAFDLEGRLTINQHGHRRVVRVETGGELTVLAERHSGARLNSPNDLAYRSDGSLYFTDPYFGLPAGAEDPRREMNHAGVYRLGREGLRLLVSDLNGPNGIAFDHKDANLYVGDWDESHKAVMKYPVLHDGSLGPGETFADLTHEPGGEAIDGVKVDTMGNVYVCGPGGLWIFDQAGQHLGMVALPESPHNIAFGGPEGRMLYMTCHTGIYRMKLQIPGPVQ